MGQQHAKQQEAALKRTPLHALHLERGARMVPFAGYEMPVSYPSGIIREHLHTRAEAGLFDVSHMGQALVTGPDHETSARALEALMPSALVELAPGAMRYGFLLNDGGGIIDDLIVTRPAAAGEGTLMLVVNADRKAIDYEVLRGALPSGVALAPLETRALLALQGPAAAAVLARHAPEAAALAFMGARAMAFDGIDCHISRSGYTGEDGFEISLEAAQAGAVARALLAETEVEPAGLGARDSLRLEAGLCLYGHDLDETVSPVEAGLGWAIGKRRREEGGYRGAARIARELEGGPKRRRVGLRLEGGAPARQGCVISDGEGRARGVVTSGGFAPSLGAPVAMGYVEPALAAPGTRVQLTVRNKEVPAEVAALPFVPHRYHRAKAA